MDAAERIKKVREVEAVLTEIMSAPGLRLEAYNRIMDAMEILYQLEAEDA